MLIDVAMKNIKGLISYFEEYRETGFYKALVNTKEIAMELNIAPTFPQMRIIKRKKTILGEFEYSRSQAIKRRIFQS